MLSWIVYIFLFSLLVSVKGQDVVRFTIDDFSSGISQGDTVKQEPFSGPPQYYFTYYSEGPGCIGLIGCERDMLLTIFNVNSGTFPMSSTVDGSYIAWAG